MRVGAQISIAILALLAVLVVLDVPLRIVFNHSGLAAGPVDLQSESALYSKALYLRDQGGKRVAILGDSTVVGGEMAEYGDAAWREHSIDKALRTSAGADDVTVINFGLNGAVPTDLKQMVKAVVPFHPQLLILALHLGSFWTPDEKDDREYYSRSWLRGLEINGDGSLDYSADVTPTFQLKFDAKVSALLDEYWFAYRIRDLLQWRFLNGPPAEALRTTAKKFSGWAKGDDAVDLHSELEHTLTKAKRRYAKVDLSQTSVQVAALRSLLDYLKETRQKTVLVYFPENPELLDRVIERARYDELRNRMREILAPYASDDLKLILDPKTLPSGDYDDDIHFNAKGYHDYVDLNLSESMRAL